MFLFISMQNAPDSWDQFNQNYENRNGTKLLYENRNGTKLLYENRNGTKL